MMITLSLRAYSIAGLVVLAAGSTVAQPSPDLVPAPKVELQRSTTAPLRARLHRPLTISHSRVTLRDALAILEAAAQVRFCSDWADDYHPDGLHPEALVDLAADHSPFVTIVESLLRQCDPHVGGGATWQLTDDGAIEVGPRSCLNAHRTMRVYDVRDLLATVPDFTQGATLDLQAALQSRSGGGSILRDPDGPTDLGAGSRPDRAMELMDLITQTVEPEQWAANGGVAATIRCTQGQLIVVAPGYIHRGLVGETSRGAP